MEARRRAVSPSPGVTGGCELSDVGAGNRTLALCNSSECSYLLNCVSIPLIFSHSITLHCLYNLGLFSFEI